MKLQTLALIGLVALAPAALAQSECSKEKTSCSAKAELAKAGECSQKAKSECSSKPELVKAGGECTQKAKAECSSKGELAKAGEGECSQSKSECSSTKGELAKADGECSSKAKAECSSSPELVKAGTSECSKSAAPAIPVKAQLAALIRSDRVAGFVVDGHAYLGDKAIAKLHGMIEAEMATTIKSKCAESAACEETLAKNVSKALGGDVCSKAKLEGMLASGRIDNLIIDGESVACPETTKAKLAKITSCETFQADCMKAAGIKAKPAIETASMTTTPATITVEHQLAALVAEGRIQGVVVDGKAYQGCDARPVLAGLIRDQVAADIKSKCEASRACEQTLASNVDKAMSGKTCAGTTLASLIESGKIQSVLVGDTVYKSCDAKAALVKLTSCETFQAECRELAGAKAETCETKKATCSSTLQ